ncbi:MAG: hypothetical protein ACXABY_33995, partial [Candidatus Thorarchaeota archaeon]
MSDLIPSGQSRFLKLDASNDPVTGDLLLKPTSNSTTTFQIQQSDTTDVLTVDTVDKGVTVAGTTTSNKINLGGGLTAFVLNGVSLDAVVGATTQIATELQYVAIQHSNVALAGARFMLSRSRGTLATPLVVQDNDAIVAIDAAAFDGTDYVLAGQIDFEVDGTPGPNDMPGRILFKTTADGGILPTERMRIDSSGNVGIANTAPGNQFNLNTPTTADATADAIFTASATTQTPVVIQGVASQTANLQEWQNSAGSNLIEIDSDGQLGIGIN